MTFNEKVNTIKKWKDPIVTALNMVLDSYYELIINYTEGADHSSAKLNKNLPEDLAPLIKDIKSDIDKYNEIRRKLLADDFSVTPLEVGYINNALTFAMIKFDKIIDYTTNARDIAKTISVVLTSEEN
ncbi:MAG: hypothetical protein J6W35_07510 [Eubacterium sp.]|nr:hypothetical protein [Eubacterium sp.]